MPGAAGGGGGGRGGGPGAGAGRGGTPAGGASVEMGRPAAGMMPGAERLPVAGQIAPAGLAPEQQLASRMVGQNALSQAVEDGIPAGMQAIAQADTSAPQPQTEEQFAESASPTGGNESGGEEASAPVTRQPQESQPTDIEALIEKKKKELAELETLRARMHGLGGNTLALNPSRRLAA